MMEDRHASAVAQAGAERERAKRLARKIEDLRARILELKADKGRLEAYLQEQDAGEMYRDLQACLAEYRKLKTLYDQLVVLTKVTLEKTTGDPEIEVFDPEVNQMRVDLNRFVFVYIFLISRLKESMGTLIQELVFGRTLVVRLSMWRSDLSYQKGFISVRLDDSR